MTGALILLGLVILVGVVLRMSHHDTPAPGDNIVGESAAATDNEPGICCGLHAVCDKLPDATPGPDDYFSDEELDRFAGRTPDAYTPEETEMFRDVLLTLRPSEVAEWGRAMRRRGIALPDEIRQEAMLLISN